MGQTSTDASDRVPDRHAGRDHREAVARRLATLSAELASVRGEPFGLGEVPAGPPAGPTAGPPAGPTAGAESSGTLLTPIPVPGRHAHRRGLAVLLPESLRGRVALSAGQLSVVAVLVAVGLAIACWWVLRGQPRVVTPAGPVLGSTAPLVTPAAPAGTPATQPFPTASGRLVVDVAGKVRHPGIAVLTPGDRVIDALEAAGGARRGVDLTTLNLARPLVDGEQILVGVAPPAGLSSSSLAVAPPGGPAGALVNLNTADQALLESLPQVGPVTAQAILAWREEHGGFTSVDELLEVDGIGDATLAQIAPHVTL